MNVEDVVDGGATIELRAEPARTNLSREKRLLGFCGGWNNCNTTALGVGVVEEVAPNGRALVRRLTGAEQRAALIKLGHPDLI